MAHAVVTHRRYYFDVLDQILVYLCGDGNWQPIGGNNPMTVKEIAAVIPATSLSDVLSFRQVNRKWNDAYRLRFEPRPTVLKLPAELVDKIVEYLAPRKAWPKEQKLIENRSTLSLESFSENREPRPPLEENPLKTFRLVCREFSRQEHCLEHLFSRVTIRFSSTEFEKLQKIVLQKDIREKVKKFTYMVPRFYVGDIYDLEKVLNQQRSTSETLQPSGSRQTASAQQRASVYYSSELNKMIQDNIEKAKGHSRIIEQGIDAIGLKLTFMLFKNLQQVKLLRVVDQSDELWSRYLVRKGQAPLSWVQAYEHATRSIAMAFLESGNKRVFHFSCQFVDVRTPLIPSLDSIVPDAVDKLKFLTLQLIDEERIDMTGKVLQLSQFCNGFMRQTRHFSGLHIGFSKVISAPLESVFHDMRWNNLRYFGIHMWSLDGEEIIGLLRRHRNLRSVRLRQIYLKEGSRWEDVLRVIKQEFNLKWLSLFRIGYGSAAIAPNYMIEDDWDAEYYEESGDESDTDELSTEPEGGSIDGEDEENEADEANDGNEESGSSPSDNDEDDEGTDDDNEFHDHDSDHEGAIGQSTSLDPQLEPIGHPNPPPSEHEAQDYTLLECKCHDPISIPDDGVTVVPDQWLSWEKWAVDNCKRHQL